MRLGSWQVRLQNKISEKEGFVILIREELDRTESHAEYTTKQLRSNVMKSLGNAKVAAFEIWLEMLRNVKGEMFNKKQYENISSARAQPITNFFRGLDRT